MVFVATLFENTLRYDIQDIVFDDLSNNFDMEIKNNLLPPGKQITLEMLGRKGSYVALAAYDKSLLQYGATHDLFYKNFLDLYEGFYAIEEDEYDIFQSIGLFARVSDDTRLAGASIATKQSEQFSQLIPYRTDFAESFLWLNTTLDRDGRKTLIEYVPHSTTAWCLTGFSMDPTYGFGIVKKPLEFNTVKAFYIVDHLPYSLKQDEEIALQFTIFNNLGRNYSTTVKLFNDQNAFDFMEPGISDGSKEVTAIQSMGTQVSFLVKAKTLGEIVIHLNATNMIESDAVEKVIRVMPKSLVKTDYHSYMFCSDSYINQSFDIILDVIKLADVGSVKISLVAEPNVLSKVIDNLYKFSDVLASTVESNMVNFVPNVAILDYLTEAAPNHAAIKKAKILLRNSFQNQLKYRLNDGSFKDFQGSRSSIFLTASVAKSMQTASKYLPEVEAKMLDQAFDWLAAKQQNDGKFEEIGPIVLNDMQTTSRKSIALTSYVITAFLENPNTKQKHSNIIKKGVDYILKYKDEIEDSFDLAIATYALSLHDSDAEVLSILKKKLFDMARRTSDTIYFSRESHSVQTTAYALLAILNDKYYYANAILAMRWLTKQRYHNGGFNRTQDTFVGLKGLTKLAQTILPIENDLVFELKEEKTKSPKIFRITAEDIDTQYFNEISSDSRRFTMSVSGKGSALFTIQAEYTLDLRNHKKRFNLDVEKLINSNNVLQLRICISYIPKLTDTRSNMALVEVNFPSGYVVDNNPCHFVYSSY